MGVAIKSSLGDASLHALSGARIRETTARVRLAFAAAFPEADLLRHLATVHGPAPA